MFWQGENGKNWKQNGKLAAFTDLMCQLQNFILPLRKG